MEARVARRLRRVRRRASATASSRASTPTRIVVRADGGEGAEVPDIYHLIKFQRSNQNTCFNQKPIVRAGETVKAGDVLADGPAMRHGRARARPERGRRVHAVAGLQLRGLDPRSRERIVKDDVFTSIHIEEFECVARDTKLGKEEITRDIPNVGEEALKDLDESGIVRIGAEVKPGDILVGKITPKGETQLSPEEKLLRAIFGEKAGDVRDSSLARAAGRRRHRHQRPRLRAQGHREGRARQARSRTASAPSSRRTRDDEIKILRDSCFRRIREAARSARRPTGKLVDDKGKVLLDEGRQAHRRAARRRSRASTGARSPVDDDGEDKVAQHARRPRGARSRPSKSTSSEKIDRLTQGRRAAAGRHQDGEGLRRHQAQAAGRRQDGRPPRQQGRRLAASCPKRTCRTSQDGTPVDIVLNPLGVPSRMNVGQILETHLGWARARARRADPEHARRASSARDELRKEHAQDLRRRQGRRRSSSTSSRDDELVELAQQARRRACTSRRRCSTARTRARSRTRSSSRGLPTSAVRRSSSTAAPARRSTRTSPWA